MQQIGRRATGRRGTVFGTRALGLALYLALSACSGDLGIISEPSLQTPERSSPLLPVPDLYAFRAVAAPESSLLRVAIEYPEPRAEIVAPDGRGFVTGTAYRARGMLGEFDVYLVLDVSESTKRPSGADIDGDGILGEEDRARRIPLFGSFFDSTSSDPDDNVLACEVKAAKTLLAQLDPDSTRVGIVAFSGDGDPATPDADIIAELTQDYDALSQKLDELLERGPQGETNLVAAVQLPTLEFERDYLSARDRDVQRLILLISDGQATLPYNLVPGSRARAAVDAAADAAEVATRIYTYAVGKESPLYIDTLKEIARLSSGQYERVAQPADLIASFQRLDLAKIESVAIQNVTNGQRAEEVLVDPYGTFAAIVDLEEGENVLEVFARATTGEERREQVTVNYRPDASAAVLPARALERRGRLLEKRLLKLYAQEIEDAQKQRGADERSVDVDVVD